MVFKVIFENYPDILFVQTAIAAFFKIELFLSATLLSYNLALYLKDVKTLMFAISALNLVALSLE